MYRWGSRENHSYILGVWKDLDAACKAADLEEENRGGKYSALITEVMLDDAHNYKIVRDLVELG